MTTKIVCIAGDDQSCVKVARCNWNFGFQIVTADWKSLLVQQKCSPELVSLQYAGYHHYRGVGKESKRFPKKRVLKNTLTPGGAAVA